MTLKDYRNDQSTAEVDMSAHAVTVRLKRVSQLRRLCLSLGKAELIEERTEPHETGTESLKNNQSDSE
jgi:hypothetical protein